MAYAVLRKAPQATQERDLAANVDALNCLRSPTKKASQKKEHEKTHSYEESNKKGTYEDI